MTKTKPTKSQQRKALLASVAHWRRMATGKFRKGEMPSGDCCPLCKLHSHGCSGCPVMASTGQPSCYGSPYYQARACFNVFGGNSASFRAAARMELRFLESLKV